MFCTSVSSQQMRVGVFCFISAIGGFWKETTGVLSKELLYEKKKSKNGSFLSSG